jgi:hypothetical protein
VNWLRNHSLTLVLSGLFLCFLGGQVLTGWCDYNDSASEHGATTVTLLQYFGTGHLWEATFENWESEFLQMAAFVILTTFLYQIGSAESRRPGVVELVDADPRDFSDLPHVPWPVRRGGWVLRLYQHSLGITFALLFVLSWIGHALGGWTDYRDERIAHGHPTSSLSTYLLSARFWFESFQNWQSEFLAIASMVWLTVYLRQRGSPESKPVHAPHSETGR